MTLKLLAVLVGMAFLASTSQAADGKFVYNKICYYCHDDGLVGAPMLGDVVEGSMRRQKGMELLYRNTFIGTGHMMERRKRQDFSDSDIKNAVDYLINPDK